MIYQKKLVPPVKINIFQSNFDKEYTKMKINIDPEVEN